MTISSKRAEYVAVASLILSIIFFILALLLGRWSGFLALYAGSWLIFNAVLIWLALLIQFHQRALAEQEKLDISQMKKTQKDSDIFEQESEKQSVFNIAQKRLQLLEKWFLPVFAGIIAAYQIVIGFYLLRVALLPDVQIQQPLLCAIVATAIAFVSFLFSRYATGMSAQRQWKPLRAGGSITLSVSVVCFLVAISLALQVFNYPVGLNILNYFIPVLLVILGFETALNIVFNIYRPRIKGQYNRAAFDSRLLGIVNEPGEILHTVAGTIDYQFGFEVSQTWFYKLIAKAILPLIFFAALVLYLSSSIVVINSDEQAIIERFGNPITQKGNVRLREPGLTLKYPWPIDIAKKYPTRKIAQLNVGFIPKAAKDKVGYGPLLWGKEHYEKEYDLLVASRQTAGTLTEGAVPVSLVTAAVPVQYRVKNLYKFLYNHSQPEKILEDICYRQLTKFAAGSTIEVDTEEDLQHSLLGAGSNEAKKILSEKIQQEVDEYDLGIDIVFVGIQGIHPNPQVAQDYQKVIGAVQKKQAAILNAQANRNLILSKLAGSVQEANQLYQLTAEYHEAKNNPDSKKKLQLAEKLDNAFKRAKGDIFKTLRSAQSYAFQKTTLSQAKGVRFKGQLKAFRANPDYYKKLQRINVYEDALENIRKFVIVSDPNSKENFVVDLQEKLTPDLYKDILGEDNTK